MRGALASAKSWDEHTADELVGTQYYIADPKTLGRLLHRPPADGGTPRLEFWYNTKLSEAGRVRCAHCKDTFENHNIGYVLVYPNGDRICIGRDCGQAHYGQRAFKKMLQAFETAKNKAYYERRRRAALAIARAFGRALEELEAQPALTAFREARSAFKKGMPLLEGVLRFEIARNGAGVTYEVQVRDIGAEERRDNQAERDAIRDGRKWTPPAKPIPMYRVETPRFGTLVAATFFAEGDAPGTAVASEVRLIKNAISALKTASQLGELTLISKGISASFARTREQLARASELPTALCDQNFLLLAGWAREKQLPGTYEAVAGALQFHDDEGAAIRRLELPASYQPASDAALSLFEAALLAADADEPGREAA